MSAISHPPATDNHSVKSFERLLAPLLGSSYRVAYSLLRDRADAEDAVQDSALQAFRGFSAFTPGTNFKAWFFRILVNRCYAQHRTRKRQPQTVEFDDAPEIYLYKRSREAGLPTEEPDAARTALDRLTVERVVDAIEGLPDEFRMVATLYFLQDFTYDEIAEALDCPVGTVRSRLHRGRRILQKALWQIAEDEGLLRKEAREVRA